MSWDHESLVERRCWCGSPNRGEVDTIDGVPAHYCRQCAEHCELALYMTRRGLR